MIRSTKRWRLPALLAFGALSAGTVALTAGSAQALPGFTIERLQGPNRAATAAVIATETFGLEADGAGSDNAVVVRSNDFADALSGNYLAGVLNAPILLVDQASVPAETLTALNALGVESINLLGGTAAIAPQVEAALVGSGFDVTRTAGTDRFDTAARVAVAGQLALPIGEDAEGRKMAIVSSGRNFPDALAAAPMVFSQKFPQLLTEVNSLPAATATAINNLGIERVILTGGTNAVSAAVETALALLPSVDQVDRIAGGTRYDTSIRIAVFEATTFGYGTDHINIATGENFPDALAGGPHGGTEKAATILTPPVIAGNDATLVCQFLTGIDDSLGSAHVFGGTLPVPDAVVDALETCGGGGTPAGQSGQIIDVDTEANTYVFIDDAAPHAEVEVTYDVEDDGFSVDGNAAATAADFEDDITVGDGITFTEGTEANDHALTNDDVTSGLVGEVAVGTGADAGGSFSIINEFSGDTLRTFTYTVADDDFGSQTPAQFEADLSEGDTIAVTAPGGVDTYTLTNGTKTGVVTAEAKTPGAAAFTLDGAFGDLPDVQGAEDTVFLASVPPLPGAEDYTVDGDADADFADFHGALSEGDTVAYSRAGGTELFVLTSGAPPVQTGQALELVPGDDEITFVLANGEQVTVDYGSIGATTVNGDTNAGPGDVEEAFSPGDTVSYRPADEDSSTTETFTLTDAVLKGTVGTVNTTDDTYEVLAADGSTVLDVVDYTGDVLKVNGGDANETQFETALNGADDNDTVEVNAAGTEHRFVAVA